MDKRVHLKIKLKSLAAEARIIRLEERRHRGPYQGDLHGHRVHVVRREARHSHLAYAFIRGHSYQAVEPKAKRAPDWEAVARLVSKYGLDARGTTPEKQAEAVALKGWPKAEEA